MLVLSRELDESIVIGDNIVVTIVDIRGDKVRLGIEAPAEVPVHRQEVYEAIQRENPQQSSSSHPCGVGFQTHQHGRRSSIATKLGRLLAFRGAPISCAGVSNLG